MIPVSKVVNVKVQAAPTYPSAKGFGLLCIFGTSASLPTGDRIRFYNAPEEVAVDFGALTEEYAAAQVFFSQAPRPVQLAIARRFAAAVPAELLGSAQADTVLAHYTAIDDGALAISVDGVVQQLDTIDLSGCVTLNGVAAAVQAKLTAVKPGATVVWDGTHFIVRSGTTGIASTIGFPVAIAGNGTDLAEVMGLTKALGAKTTQGAAAETIADTLNNVQLIDGSWYGVVLTKEATEQNLKDAAAWAEANGKIFGYTTSAANVMDGADNTDIGSAMQAAGYSRIIGQYDPDDPYAIVSALARAFTVDFNGNNTVITLKFKQEPGVTPAPLTETQRKALVAKNVNYYAYFGDSAMLAEGVMANGRFFDEVHGLDWLQNAIETAVFGYLYTTPTRIPQTDRGVARVVQQVEIACNRAVANGLLAAGEWNGDSFGDVKSGDYLPKGFYVYADPVAAQSQANRELRKAPPITVLAKGSGAIHGVDITVTFER